MDAGERIIITRVGIGVGAEFSNHFFDVLVFGVVDKD